MSLLSNQPESLPDLTIEGAMPRQRMEKIRWSIPSIVKCVDKGFLFLLKHQDDISFHPNSKFLKISLVFILHFPDSYKSKDPSFIWYFKYIDFFNNGFLKRLSLMTGLIIVLYTFTFMVLISSLLLVNLSCFYLLIISLISDQR